ncbi:Ppx/GppA phosphatase family protein [uncultured Brevundimonas sp.]|uniref:Ppx/GppA phosphatase family protein n=1 Tax=uncultured Brevundimonas sp. TaxID=213418 RepID=UPI0030EF97A0|tara:strand:+ start:3678 stop:5192 length:1515 start_codon:yes stop_codon:yes gene_type:complete
MTGFEDPVLASRDIAVIDIGSNSVRLVLYRLEGRAVWAVFNEKVLAGLGRDLAATGRLSKDGMTAALAALKRFAAVIEGVRPAHTFAVATAAVREAVDGHDFCDLVAAQTGLVVRILSGAEEARYSARGVLAGIPDAEGVTADMGGASLELARISGGEAGPGITLPLGPFALIDPDGFDAGRLRETIAERLKAAGDYRCPHLYAVGGAWRSIAQVHMDLTDYPLHIVHQYEISASAARDTARLIARQSRTSLDKMAGVSRKRADTLPYAALVLEGLIDRLGLKRITISAWGVREGLLFEALDGDVAAADPLLAGCQALGARQGISPTLPGALNGWIQRLMQAAPDQGDHDRDAILTAAACHLADLGARLHPDHRTELVFDQILRAPIPGQTHAERAFLACALNARYGGGAATPQPVTVSRLLNDDQRLRARTLGLAIRLACDLSGRSPHLLANAGAAVDKGVLKLTALDGYADVLLGEQTRRRAKALADAMGLKLDMGRNTEAS